MKVRIDPSLFRPVTIRLENQDELDQLIAIIEDVARNRINHTEQVVSVAKALLISLAKLLDVAEGDE